MNVLKIISILLLFIGIVIMINFGIYGIGIIFISLTMLKFSYIDFELENTLLELETMKLMNKEYEISLETIPEEEDEC